MDHFSLEACLSLKAKCSHDPHLLMSILEPEIELRSSLLIHNDFEIISAFKEPDGL